MHLPAWEVGPDPGPGVTSAPATTEDPPQGSFLSLFQHGQFPRPSLVSRAQSPVVSAPATRSCGQGAQGSREPRELVAMWARSHLLGPLPGCRPGLVRPWWGVVSECQGPRGGVSLPVWTPTWSGSLKRPGGPSLMQGPGAWLRHLLYTHRALVTAGPIPEPLLPLLVSSSLLSGYPLFSACPILNVGWKGGCPEPWLGWLALLPTATRPGRKEVHSLDCRASPSGLQALVCSSLLGPLLPSWRGHGRLSCWVQPVGSLHIGRSMVPLPAP